MKDLTLVIMAAGMGSRFGGLKQIEPVGPNGEFIIDYSIYDAILAGFTKVVLIIKEENYEIIRNTIGKRIEDKITVEYVFQKNSDLPEGYSSFERKKPLGTAHAIYCARNVVHENFVIINADDFYGRDAFVKAAEFLQKDSKGKKHHFCAVCYHASHTMTENGAVKRGVVEQKDGFLTSLVESSIEKVGDKIIASPLSGDPSFEISFDELVSMNLFGFTKDLFPYLERELFVFLEDHKENLETAEFFIPDVVYDAIEEGFCDVKVLNTDAVWYGVTYKEDKDAVVQALRLLVSNGTYPEKLW